MTCYVRPDELDDDREQEQLSSQDSTGNKHLEEYEEEEETEDEPCPKEKAAKKSI